MIPAKRSAIRRRWSQRFLLAAALGLSLASMGCRTTAYYERERIADHCMRIDADATVTYFRHKLEAAREGTFGGFGGSVAGGCGCQ